MAALATTAPVGALRVETTGICDSPVGQTVRKLSVVLGMTVKFSE